MGTGSKLALFVGVPVAMLAVVLVGAGTDSEPATEAGDSAAVASRDAADDAGAADPVDSTGSMSAEELLAVVVRETNAEAKVKVTGQQVVVRFPISDNFTGGMIRIGAQDDTVKLLEAVHGSGFDPASVEIKGSFPMQDEFGNTERDVILDVGYSAEVLDRIDYDNVNYERIWDLADGVSMVHPELR